MRRARVVVASGALLLAGYLCVGLGLVLSDTPMAPRIQVALAGLATVVAIGLVRWGGRVQVAAVVLTTALAATAILQAVLDAGVRDPILATVALAPLIAAMSSGARLAIISAVLCIAGVIGVYAADATGTLGAAFSTPGQLDVYSALLYSAVALATALAGALYDRHVGRALSEAEGRGSRLDAALRASEARYRSLFDHVPVGMYRTARDGEVLLANATLAEMIGAESAEAARGQNIAAVYADPQDRERFGALARRDGEVHRFETRWRGAGGVVRHVRIGGRVAADASGDPLYYEGMVEDVTAEREAREALFRNEARFRALVQRSTDVVVVVNREGQLSYVSPAVTGMLGYAPEVLIGTDVLDRVHDEDRRKAEAAIREAGSMPGTRIEVRLGHADGHFVFVEAAGTPLYDDPSVAGLVLNLRDVTERKRAQTVLVQAKRQAEEVALLKSSFLANMSHEIRTPLTAILGFSDVLSSEIDDPQLGEFVELISRSGRRLMDTLNSVLDLARLESGHGELQAEIVDVASLAEETAEILRHAAVENGLTLTSHVEKRPLEAVVDEAALARVLHNLVGNAIKFTPEGTVSVTVRSEHAQAGASILVDVTDTGIGIDEAFLPDVFNEFVQESSGADRAHEGVGLGLSISRHLVEKMGGTISVASVKGEGTTFTLAFPAVNAEPVGPDRRPLVLVVDDYEQAREVARRALGERFRVATASNGPEAMEVVARERPVAAVLDIHLGHSISGEDVMRALRESPAFNNLPIVAVTAYALPGDRARFLAAGFDAYVKKPYDRSVLVDSVMQAIFDRAPEGPEPEVEDLVSADDALRFVARKTTPAPQATPPSDIHGEWA